MTNKTNEQIEIQKDALLSRKTMARINFFDQFADNDEVIITGETSFDNNVKYSSFSGSITVNDLLEVYRKTMLDNPRIWVAIIEGNLNENVQLEEMERELDLQILVNKENQADLTPIQSIREFKNQLCEWTYSSTNKCSYNQL